MDLQPLIKCVVLIGAVTLSMDTLAYDSGSTGADGAFAPAVDTELTLPANGIFNFTDVIIPAGVTVTFGRNASNTPVYILASGDITIDGIIDVSGGDVPAAPGPTPLLSDNASSLGGPGGFVGGHGSFFYEPRVYGANGAGPGGGSVANDRCGGGGGGYGSVGGEGQGNCANRGPNGVAYGNSELAFLVGGSGGGGGGADENSGFRGEGGSGGGGAILLAASGQIIITGEVIANGGNVAEHSFPRGGGGAGSGGAIRVVGDFISGEGLIIAEGGVTGITLKSDERGGGGGFGRIRLEANSLERLANTIPAFSFDSPQPALFSGLPQLSISTFGGVVAPAFPTGEDDIKLAGLVANPIAVEFSTSNVPLGTVISLRVSPNGSRPYQINSAGVTGSFVAGTAIVDVDMLSGSSTLLATTTFTVVASVGDALSRYAMGERVKSVSLLASANGNVTEFTTVSGKTYRYPGDQVAVNGGQG